MSVITSGERMRMTLKSRLFLWFFNLFNGWSQWFLEHCDYEPYPQRPLHPNCRCHIKEIEEEVKSS